MNRLFGTDGVRGVANQELTPELAFQLGRAGAAALTEGRVQPRMVIGRDTRISGDMLEAALVAGITSVGANPVLVGVLPTPAVAYLTRTMAADAGIMISASHNPVEDNGIKFFARSGFKLTDETEENIAGLLQSDLVRPTGPHLGRTIVENTGVRRYLDYLKQRVPISLAGLHIALDCAQGAASFVAPTLLRELGAKLTVINDEPDGTNINVQCGSTHPEAIQQLVRDVRANIGITHDGDADRVLAVDEKGNLVDGDHILAICGLRLLAENRLPQKRIAATVYSNGGLRHAFRQAGGDVVITQAGDRYVLEVMIEQELALGGEQSGHIIFLDDNTTGDGLLTALKLLSVLVSTGEPLSHLASVMPVFPQRLENVTVTTKEGWEDNERIQQAIAQATERLGDGGRVLVRASGTEPVLRIMGEHPDESLLAEELRKVVAVVQGEQGD